MNTTFNTWLSEQFAQGLVDIKFAVLPGKGVSVEAIQNELLSAEAAIHAGFFRAAPEPTSRIPEEIALSVNKTVLH